MSDEIDERIRDVNWRDYAEHQKEVAARLQYQFEYAQSALRTLVLVNGGAIIALFTFIGNEKAAFDRDGLWLSFAWLVVALFCSLFAYFGAFFSQASFMQHSAYCAQGSREAAGGLNPDPHRRENERKARRNGNWFMVIGLASSFASLGFFALGAWAALSAMVP